MTRIQPHIKNNVVFTIAYIKENKLRDMLHQRGFYETHRNQYKSYANAFSDLGDETVADRNTGLIWQKAGSSRRISIGMARRYIRKLNKKKFGGYSDWRLPTIEELASLNTSGIEKGAHINPIFNSSQNRCWSNDHTDTQIGMEDALQAGWIINFSTGTIDFARWCRRRSNICDGSSILSNQSNYVRAVRTVK